MRFDVHRGTVEGAPRRVRDVSYSRTFGYAQMDVSQTGTLVYRDGAEGGRQLLAVWVDPLGNTRHSSRNLGRTPGSRLSPDGPTACPCGHRERRGRTSGSTTRRATTRGSSTTKTGDYSGFTWWSVGHHLVFHDATGMTWIDTERPELSGALTTSHGVQVPCAVSPDGRLADDQIDPDTGFDLWTMPIEASDSGLKAGTPQPFLRTRAFEVYPCSHQTVDGSCTASISPDPSKSTCAVSGRRKGGESIEGRRQHTTLPPPNAASLGIGDNQQIMVASYRFAANALVAGPSRQWPCHSCGHRRAAQFRSRPGRRPYCCLGASDASGRPADHESRHGPYSTSQTRFDGVQRVGEAATMNSASRVELRAKREPGTRRRES